MLAASTGASRTREPPSPRPRVDKDSYDVIINDAVTPQAGRSARGAWKQLLGQRRECGVNSFVVGETHAIAWLQASRAARRQPARHTAQSIARCSSGVHVGGRRRDDSPYAITLSALTAPPVVEAPGGLIANKVGPDRGDYVRCTAQDGVLP